MSDEHKQMRIDAGLVRELAELLSANELSEIEVEDGDRKIRVKRELTVAAAPVQHVVAAPQAASPAAAAPTASAADTASTPMEQAGELVRSPMVGTCYLSAEPGAPAFVGIGDTVKQGDTLLIVEAMKVMNPIVAPRAGKITQLLVANAQPVEFDQPLVVIE
ncbi:acetyl-CoA carboxylase biotin carboxyl carrier protein [Sphingomonas kaistensis]|uniref:Biotin carboxyl carrier protein of acetyl-CoA carboxylase n=1 Tax=Sphingomonas kaistensis TaxID=298708 RepID=A0A7X5Y5I3_9SPHN|nr:acetyl-CoA carboxylase biotin carboxyl carrier protein [Sphingomonas kaistensis]NJC05464.1 acetyl-CoA carboxylase biotin carboxyl carrier protein [Sphingomonas kaistensis]